MREAASGGGKTLRELGLPKRYGVMVLEVINLRNHRTFNPPADHVLQKGDDLILIGPGGAVEKICDDLTVGKGRLINCPV